MFFGDCCSVFESFISRCSCFGEDVVFWELVSSFPVIFIKSSEISVVETVHLSFLLSKYIFVFYFEFPWVDFIAVE